MNTLEQAAHYFEIINALTEYHKRCPICYRYTNGDTCQKCNEYYLECVCTPLTVSQITEGVGFVELEDSHKAVILSNVWGPTS